ncbi:U1 small nuclear ribonucleoprotein 70 kDa isoform X2 [Eurytemora carolleeae]|uniref:U1 small nuclear ribonucleoprotein 70 kDa isoform X2 n=2 Tax=Eurytemora carolleeae TaxID=1294199 RepID=UPI000C75796F|nr:U1 small nuclear ribonucleoprotein 70 kDa isoform X2 [Eurytemora carolleeae]|eukprot:XP_023335190.1 U1 small nuclear ribonucleoprotein 70 kDa-like isoform X2 [Eurytemora affinis]
MGNYLSRDIGQTSAGNKGNDDSKTLGDSKFSIGDFLDVAISPPNRRTDRMDYGRRGGFGERRSFGSRRDEHDMRDRLDRGGDRMDRGARSDRDREDRGRERGDKGREERRDRDRVRDRSQ